MNTRFHKYFFRFFFLLCFHVLLCGAFAGIGRAEDCGKIVFEHIPSDYYGPGDYFMTCSADGIRIRCYHYHRHWVCEKGTTLYWDRRLDTAARTACGCSLPADVVPASPATSGKPGGEIFGPEE
jgi:hypothetical protein